MQDAPPDSIGVVDTMGCALPQAIKYLVRLPVPQRIFNSLPGSGTGIPAYESLFQQPDKYVLQRVLCETGSRIHSQIDG